MSTSSLENAFFENAFYEHAFYENAFFENAFFENAFFENAFFENFTYFWRARSRLYQNEILQENMRSTAFFKPYKSFTLQDLHPFAPLQSQNFRKKSFRKFANFAKFLKIFAIFRKFWQILAIF